MSKINKGGASMGINIDKHKRKRRWNYTTLATEMGVTRQTIAKWADGTTEPKESQLVKLATLLGCTIEELLETEAQ